MRRWLWHMHAVQVSAGAFALALGLVAWTLWRASQITIPSPSGLPTGDPTLVPVSIPASGYNFQRVLASIGKDPFHPERRRPGQRFQLPADQAGLAARRAEQQTTAAALRLIGTVVAPDGGGFAMCEVQGGTPRIVRLGEQVGGWTLKRVTPGSAEFATPTGTVVVRVPKAGT